MEDWQLHAFFTLKLKQKSHWHRDELSCSLTYSPQQSRWWSREWICAPSASLVTSLTELPWTSIPNWSIKFGTISDTHSHFHFLTFLHPPVLAVICQTANQLSSQGNAHLWEQVWKSTKEQFESIVSILSKFVWCVILCAAHCIAPFICFRCPIVSWAFANTSS